MKRLTETTMFRELSSGISNLDETVLKTINFDFAHAVMDVCSHQQTDVPAYFTLHYTLSELEQLMIIEEHKELEKKCHVK